MKQTLFLPALIFILFSSCSKIGGSNTDINTECDGVKAAKIVASQAVYAPGETIQLSITPNNPRPDGYITWYKADGNSGQIGINSTLEIDNCSKSDQGWYIMSISNNDCGTFNDSTYVTVKNVADTAPCTLGNNSITFSSIPDISPASVSFTGNSSYGTKELDAYASYGYPELYVYFNQYWNSNEPEDGKYSLVYIDGLSGNSNVYTLYISCLFEDISFTAESGDVYVSHDSNGKLVVQFCSLSMTGDDGQSSFTTVATGKLTAP